MKHTVWLIGLIVLAMVRAARADVTILNTSTGLAIGVPGGSAAQGVQLVAWHRDGAANQRWRVVSTGSGWFKLVNVHSGLCMAVGSSNSEGTAVIQWHDDGHLSQQWRWGSGGLVNRSSGKMLGTSGGGSTAQGAKLLLWPPTGNPDQAWHFVR